MAAAFDTTKRKTKLMPVLVPVEAVGDSVREPKLSQYDGGATGELDGVPDGIIDGALVGGPAAPHCAASN